MHAIYFKHDKKISKDIFDDSKLGEKYFAEDLLQKAWEDRLKKDLRIELYPDKLFC